MRILQVTPYYAPAWAYGGPPRVVYELSRELKGRGHSVTVLTTDALGPHDRARPSHEDLDGVQIVRTPNLSNNLAWRYHLFLPRGMGAFLRKHLREYDVIHMHMYRTAQNVLIHHFSVRSGVPYVFSAHGSLPRIVRKRFAKALFDIAVGPRILQGAVRSIALSDMEKTDYEFAGVPVSRISIIFNGVDASIRDVLPRRGGFVKTFSLENKRLVTYLGRLNARKGLDDLLRSFQEVSQRFGDTVLVVAGADDGHKERLVRLAEQLSISDRVFFPGFLSHAAKLQLLVDSALVVYPASNEPFGLVPFEALLCEKPVVVSRESGCGELIHRARAGLTFPVGDVDSLRAAILTGLTADSSLDEMVRRGQKLVRDELSWRRISSQMEQVYKGAVRENTQARLAP